jgi:hypothetical protein
MFENDIPYKPPDIGINFLVIFQGIGVENLDFFRFLLAKQINGIHQQDQKDKI